jgi:hypothetical protein
MKIYVGFDGMDHRAYERCVRSIREHASVPVNIQPLYDWELRHAKLYWRSYWVNPDGQRFDGRDGRPFSTDFSFTRFLVPALQGYDDEWVMFCDPDMLFRADVAELFDLIDESKSLMCVKHRHAPMETEKMGGLIQSQYQRKNWSSLMIFNAYKCKSLTKYLVNNETGSKLHGMYWLPDTQIGGLPEEWNWLEGWSDPQIDPKVVHFTRGTPDLPECEDVAFADEWWAA